MIVQQTPLHKTPLLSKLILDYCHSKSELSELVNNLPAQKNWSRQIQEKKTPLGRRQIVHSSLIHQYTNTGLLNSSRKQSIDKLLSTNTFTVCTGHQLNLLTGPAYFIYKIAGCIKQAQEISKETGKSVLPVYWMASEDHDWDEINHTHLWRNKLSWDKEVHGPVGRTSLYGLKEVILEFKAILGDFASEEFNQIIDKALNESNNLTQFTFILVDAIFAQHELLILDADSADLKRQFIPVMEDELLNTPSLGQVQKHSEILENLGHKAQVTAREINLFYIEDDLRERIVAVENGFSSSSNTYHWTTQEMLELLQSNPEKFSPNVVLRPLYQEFILPNLAYIGGPGELSYWLQLKGVFDHFNVEFPQLVLRNYALFIKAKDVEKMKGLGLNISDFFQSLDTLLSRWGAHTGDTDLSEIKDKIQPIWKDLETKVQQVDKSLENSIKALEQKFSNEISNLEKKMVKAVKQAETTKVNQIQKIHESIHPSGVFQERYMNFFSLAGSDYNKVISTLIDEMDTEEPSLMICMI